MPLSFFATHYGSLTDDFSYHPNIRNMHMSTIVDDEKCEVSFRFCPIFCDAYNLLACLLIQTRGWHRVIFLRHTRRKPGRRSHGCG